LSSIDLLEQARRASQSNAPEAAQLWSSVQIDSANVAREVASSLLQLKKVEEADRILASAIQVYHNDGSLYVQYARTARTLNLPDEEGRRWKLMRDRFPKNPVGYVQGSIFLARTKSFSGAEELLRIGIDNVGSHESLLIQRAVVAGQAGKWSEALQHWRSVDPRVQLDQSALLSYTATLTKTGQMAEAQEHLEAGLKRFPSNVTMKIRLAELASASGHWGEAVALWRSVSDDEPNSPRTVKGLGQAIFLYNLHTHEGDGEPGAGLEHAVDVGRTENAGLREMLLRFESVGRNCEFGLLQRHFGAEPLGLLRWAGTPVINLIAGIRNNFDGLGDLENTTVEYQPSEMWVNDSKYGFRYHTFIKLFPNADFEQFRIKQARHLSYLRGMFLDRLEDGESIYVYSADYGLDQHEADAIYEGLSVNSKIKLLVVHRADSVNSAGSVTQVRDGLFYGYIERFGLEGRAEWDLDINSWTAVCTNMLVMIDGP
jgi:tetratricopeptide (TPR) repeat protein